MTNLTDSKGIDWAYQVLVDMALLRSEKFVRERAKQFRIEVLDAMVGMACADIDWHRGKKYIHAYEIVRDVCIKLVDEAVEAGYIREK